MKELNKALAKIQLTLKAPKNQFNKFGNYSYRSCEDILEAVKPLLKDLTLTITDDIYPVGDRYYVKSTAILSDGSSEIKAHAFAREAAGKKGMDAAQVTGAASSYARKYALNGLFAIDDEKDADTKDNTEKKTPAYKKKTVSERAKERAETEKDTAWRDKKATPNQLAWVDKRLKAVKYTDYKPAELKVLNAGQASDLIGNIIDTDDVIKIIEDNRK